MASEAKQKEANARELGDAERKARELTIAQEKLAKEREANLSKQQKEALL